jgi:hypothetical protein
VSTCAVCGTRTRDPALEGWHVFEDGLGEEHALCSGCIHASSETDVPPGAQP